MSRRKRRASPQTSRAATRLARHAEWAKGFWLAYLFSIAPNQVHILQNRLAAKLASIGRKQRILRPETPQALEGILATILEHPNVGCVWVEAIRDPEFEQGAWTKAWFNLILRTNERRELLREVLTGGLILVAHPGLKSAFRNAGPDLWSIRTMTFELPPGPSGDAEGRVATHFDEVLGHGRMSRRAFLSGPSTVAWGPPTKFVDAELLDEDVARWASTADEYSPEDQARVFMQLATRLRESGRQEEATRASEAAVQRYRELAATRPDVFRADLARALVGLGKDLGEREALDREHAFAALEVSRHAVEIFRALVREHPDDDSIRLGLADALLNVGDRWSALGITQNIAPVFEEAVALYRASSEVTPSGSSALALALGRLGSDLLVRGQPLGAIVVLEEAVDRLRTLGDQFLSPLALTLIKLAICLRVMGREEEGLVAVEDAVSILGELSTRWPSRFRQEHATSLALLGECRRAMQQPGLAVEAFAEALRKLEPTSGTTDLQKTTAAALRDSCREAGLELPEDLRERTAQLLE